MKKNRKIRAILFASLAVLAGTAALAGATGCGSSGSDTTVPVTTAPATDATGTASEDGAGQQAGGQKSPDPESRLTADVVRRAIRVAEKKTGATTNKVKIKDADRTGSPLELEVELVRDSTEYEVRLDHNFKVLEVETDDTSGTDGALTAPAAITAIGAAETETGAFAIKVETESPDHDDPKGTAYEVKLLKNGTEFKVLLDEDFKVLKVSEDRN